MTYQIMIGDVLHCLRQLPSDSVHTVVTSPPYWGLRDYGVAGQIGLEATPAEFLAKLVAVFAEVRRVLRPDGTCWVNMGDSYNAGTSVKRPAPKTGVDVGGWLDSEIDGGARVNAKGLKPKDLVGMPWRLAFALQEDGWWLRQDIIWSKPNPTPESVTDRCTKAHEYLFLLTKSARYYYDAEAVKEAAGGWNNSDFHDGKNLAVHPNVGKHRPAKGNSKTFRGGVYTQGKAFDNGGSMERDSQGNAPNATGKRNKRSVWEIATEAFPEAHFATFPTKLVEPCILAGTSEKGVCERCGAPWVRVTESFDTGQTQKMPDGMAVGNYAHGSILAEGRLKGEGGKPVTAERTVGWMPGCDCHDCDPLASRPPAVVPSTVLDPFNGSGTTGLVALANRCEYIGIELNPEYAAMAERRLQAASAQEILL